MKLSTLFALLFAGAALLDLLRPTPDVEGALIGLTLAFALTVFRLFVTGVEEARSDHFLRWLEANRVRLLEGEATYEGVRITPGTELRSFVLTVSIGVLTFRTERRLYVPGLDPIAGYGAFFALLSFLLGWWGLPYGPIYTLQALATNLSGGERTTVAALLHGPRTPAPVQRAPGLAATTA